MGSIFEMDADFLRICIIAWALFKIIFEAAIRLDNYNSERHSPALTVLVVILFLLGLAALIVSPVMCIFDLIVYSFTLKRYHKNVENSTREEVMKLYHIPPYDDRKF